MWHSRLGLSVTLSILSGCSAAGPGPTWTEIATEPEVMRGVVNGLWRYDREQNLDRLLGRLTKADPKLADDLAERHQVRVGIDRGWLLVGEFAEVVVLPPDWTYSLEKVVNDGRTVNLGDVVEIDRTVGTSVENLLRILRKCDQPPLPSEEPEWNIGCKQAPEFNKHGYAGEHYFFSAF